MNLKGALPATRLSGLNEKILATELEDNGSPYGGIGFVGETVADFLESIGLEDDITLAELNGHLATCGIKTIKEW